MSQVIYCPRKARLSKAAVSRLLRRHRSRLAALEPPPPVRRSERACPGDLIHFDLKQLARLVRTGDRQHDHTPGAGWEFLHIAIDDHSRLAFAQLLPDETAHSAIRFLHAALAFFAKLGIHAKRLYSDNGSGDRSRARRAASAALGLKQRSARLPIFLHNDNWHRPHHSLKLRSPISRLSQPRNNLLSLHS